MNDLRETQQAFDFENVEFQGAVYDAELDYDRLKGQVKAIYDLMKDATWRTLEEIELATGYPQASISAQLRNLRKKHFGYQTVHKRRRGEEKKGLWEMQLIIRQK